MHSRISIITITKWENILYHILTKFPHFPHLIRSSHSDPVSTKGNSKENFQTLPNTSGFPLDMKVKKYRQQKKNPPAPDDRVKKGRKTPTTNQGSEFRCSVVPFVVLVPPRSRHSVPPLSGSTPVRLEEIRDTRTQGGPLPVTNEAPWGPWKKRRT